MGWGGRGMDQDKPIDEDRFRFTVESCVIGQTVKGVMLWRNRCQLHFEDGSMIAFTVGDNREDLQVDIARKRQSPTLDTTERVQ